MSVTVAIPTTGVRPVLRRATEAALRSAALVGPDAEVLVVVNGRDDAPGLGRIDSPLLRVLHLERASLPGARNCAMAVARHDTLLFTDDDVIVPPSWCAELRAALSDRGWAAASVPVRLQVHGPVTALINYQRSFDSQPSGPDGPGNLVTGSCGLRRDLIPADVRFDEGLGCGEDLDFGRQLWSAGLDFHFLGEATPVLHEIPETVEPNIERALAYGQGAGMVAAKLSTVPQLLQMFRSRYAAITSPEHGDYRRFVEFTRPEVRAAFTVYEFIFSSAYLAGCLNWLSEHLGQPVIRLDRERLTGAYLRAADKAAERVSAIPAADWRSLPVDYSRLAGASGAATSDLRPDDPTLDVIAELKTALARHAPVITDRSRSAGAVGRAGRASADRGWAAALGRPDAPARLHRALTELRNRESAITSADIDNFVRVVRIPFKTSCEIIEKNLAFRS